MATYNLTMTRDGVKIPVEVEADYEGPSRGMRDSLGGVRGAGPPIEPDEPGYFVIEECLTEDGEPLELNDTEYEELEAKLQAMLESEPDC